MISIIVPIYNTEKYLNKCLTSLVKQKNIDFEVICVNDGSPDDSDKIIEKFKKKYPKLIRSYKKKNGGLSDARNYGIKKAKGDYIGFVDSDDWVEKDMFSKMYNYAIKKDLDIVVCDTFMEYENNTEILKSNLHYSDEDVRNYIISYPMACTRLIKKELLEDDYMFTKGILYEDLCLTPTLVNKTIKVGFLEEALYHYLQRSNSIMNQMEFNDKLFDIIKVLNHVYKIFDENKNLENYYEEIEYLYITHLLRSATLRFLGYKDGAKHLSKLIDEFKDKFPNWQDNKYFKNSSFKLKLICYLANYKIYSLIKLIIKIKK
ncbi:MAG: glycosyltransferase family 2 protein [Bacilli bacterium]|nr:glycosyltransferase family 2 protein [Bacilli bacterium]